MSWCTATCSQRINANGFNAIWFILLKQRHYYFKFDNITHNHNLQMPSLKMLTLCTPVLHHARPVLPSSSFSMLPPFLLGFDCLSSLPLGGPGPPSLLAPELTPFPSGPRQRPAFLSGTGTCPLVHSFSPCHKLWQSGVLCSDYWLEFYKIIPSKISRDVKCPQVRCFFGKLEYVKSI